MPSPAFMELFDRVFSDEGFVQKLRTEHESALDEFDLTAEERQALLSLDVAQVEALGVDERISKRFRGPVEPY
ncbi:MAG: Os1348 family NHLP clan protein [Chloroflexota bacterium]